MDFDPCQDIDWSQIDDCRGGVCYSFCRSEYRTVRAKCDGVWRTYAVWVKYRTGTTPPRECIG